VIALYWETRPVPQIDGIQSGVSQRELTEVLKITRRKALAARSAERLCKCVYQALTILGAVLSRLLELDNACSHKPISQTQDLLQCPPPSQPSNLVDL
jgi:hypothetical protein